MDWSDVWVFDVKSHTSEIDQVHDTCFLALVGSVLDELVECDYDDCMGATTRSIHICWRHRSARRTCQQPSQPETLQPSHVEDVSRWSANNRNHRPLPYLHWLANYLQTWRGWCPMVPSLVRIGSAVYVASEAVLTCESCVTYSFYYFFRFRERAIVKPVWPIFTRKTSSFRLFLLRQYLLEVI